MPRDFAVTARLAFVTATVMFALIVVGSIVRTTGSGLACPDWPLCHGRLIPPLQFNILIEWFHRLLALVVGLGLLSTATWTWARPATRARLGGHAATSIALYLSQALLGALTVWKLLDPNVNIMSISGPQGMAELRVGASVGYRFTPELAAFSSLAQSSSPKKDYFYTDIKRVEWLFGLAYRF